MNGWLSALFASLRFFRYWWIKHITHWDCGCGCNTVSVMLAWQPCHCLHLPSGFSGLLYWFKMQTLWTLIRLLWSYLFEYVFRTNTVFQGHSFLLCIDCVLISEVASGKSICYSHHIHKSMSWVTFFKPFFFMKSWKYLLCCSLFIGRNLDLPLSINPLYSDGLFHLIWYNKLGMVHCIYWGVTGYNFQIKLSFILLRSF